MTGRYLTRLTINLVAVAALGLAHFDAGAATRFSRATGLWNAAIWSATSCIAGALTASVPGAADDATICAGNTVTLDSSRTVNTVIVNGSLSTSTFTLTIDNTPAVTLNTGGTFTGNATLILDGATTVAAGTSASITFNNLSLMLNVALGGTPRTYTLGAGSIAAMTVNGNFDIVPTNVGGAARSLGVARGTVTSLAVTGRTRVAALGAGNDSTSLNTTGMTSFTSGTLELGDAAGGTGTNTLTAGATAITLNGAAGPLFTRTANGVFTAGTSTVTMNSAASVALTSGTFLTTNAFNSLTVNMAGQTGTLGAAITVNNTLLVSAGTLSNNNFAITSDGASTFQVNDGATFAMTGTSVFPPTSGGTHFSTYTFQCGAYPSCSTVSYRQTTSPLTLTTQTYGHLDLAPAGTATQRFPAGTMTINGNLVAGNGTNTTTADAATNNAVLDVNGGVTIAANATLTAPASSAFTVARDWTNNGAFTHSSGTVTFDGAAAQAINGTTTFNNLIVANTSGGVSLGASHTVTGTLTLTNGVITTGASTLITSASCPGSVSRPGGGGHVAGFLRLQVPAGASTCVHDVGDSTTYRPITLTFPATTTAGNLTGSVSQAAGDHANIVTSALDVAQSVNRFWTLTNGGVGLGGGSYSATFTFVAGDVDALADPLTFEVARWDGASWTTETAGTRTATTTQATGLTAFSDFAVGQRRLNNFLIGGIPGSPVCNPQTIGITARNSNNQTLNNYRGLVNLSTSTNQGDWSVVTANGTLTNGAADDGAATYQFVVADAGSISLRLTDTHIGSLTISVNDSTAGVTSTSGTIQFDNHGFAITNDTIQVAGRNQAMSVQLNCVGVDTGYAGAKNLKAWVALSGDDPGGTRPSINAVTLPSSAPGATNVTLTFAAGVASFNLASTDVGKYDLKLLDNSRAYSTATDINGTSSTITTRPFALVVSGIKQGATNNPGGTAAAGSGFIAAADTFEATVGAYRHNSAVDVNNDGVLDAGATLAQAIANGAAPSYKWPTTLSAAAPFTPSAADGGTLATLNGSFVAGDFSGGVATKTTLNYGEVGSFTMAGAASSVLNTAGVNLTARIYNSAGTESGVIGRFFPDHFTLLAGSTITPACGGGAFTYMGQPNLGYTFGIEARNKSDIKTSNYFNTFYNTGTVAMQAENNNSGTDLSSRLPAPTGSWSAGSYSYSTTTATFSRPASPDGPFDLLQIAVRVTDADGPVLAARDMNPTTSGACVPATTCTGKSIGAGTTIMRFGRLVIGNANGSSTLPLPVRLEAQYWIGKAFVTNSIDGCTPIAASVASSNINMTNYTAPLTDSPKCLTALSGGGVLSAGRRTLQLAPPATNGSVDLTVNLGAGASGNNTCLSVGASPTAETAANRAYLQSGTGFTQNPSARATFGIFKGSGEVIFIRENF